MNQMIFPVLIFGGAFLFAVLLIVFIVKYNNVKARKGDEKRQEAFQTGLRGRARIVDLRRSPFRRSNNFELYKVLLEVFPENSQSAFSTVNVWEVEPLMENSMGVGSFIPVRFNPEDMQKILPDTLGIRYSYTYQYAHLGIEDNFQPEQMTAAPPAPKAKTIFRKRSKIILFGMPLWEVAANLKTHRYSRRAKARAFIAIGDSAAGLIAVGSVARGLIAVGRLSFGIVSVGGTSIGVFSIGLFPMGLVSLGPISVGLIAIGGVAVGLISAGLLSFGQFVFGRDFRIPGLIQMFESFKAFIGLNYNVFDFVVIAGILGFALMIGSMIAEAIIKKLLIPNNNSLESPRE